MMKRTALLFAVLLFAGCADRSPFKVGDTLVSDRDGTELGEIIELGNHNFANGASGQSVHVKLASGGDAWYTVDTTKAAYRAKP